MTVSRQERDGIVVLDLAGEYFGGSETETLARAITNEIARGNLLMVLDLSHCRAMNSTALGVMIEAHHTCHAMGGALKLCGAERRVKSLLDILHADHLFDHYATEAEARASFVERPTSSISSRRACA